MRAWECPRGSHRDRGVCPTREDPQRCLRQAGTVCVSPAHGGSPPLSRTWTWLGSAPLQQHILGSGARPHGRGGIMGLGWAREPPAPAAAEGLHRPHLAAEGGTVLLSCSPREGTGSCGHSSEHTQHGLGTAMVGQGGQDPFPTGCQVLLSLAECQHLLSSSLSTCFIHCQNNWKTFPVCWVQSSSSSS